MNILEARDIVKDFSGHKALDNVTIEVSRGSVYGLLGPNGAGKTTLIRIINHITAPDSGTLTLDGKPLTAESVTKIGYLPEERGLYKKMRVGEQAIFFARLKGLTATQARESLQEWFERLEITDWWDKKVEELSKGMAQKIQFIITVLHRPKLLIFDEPFSGFDPINADLLKNEILRLRDNGATVIFSTHNMSSVEELCDSIALINRGKVILNGTLEEVRRSYGDNTYALEFSGDGTTLVDTLREKGILVDSADNKIVVRTSGVAAKHEILNLANSQVDITSFAPVLPSMDNIFIKAVKDSQEG